MGSCEAGDDDVAKFGSRNGRQLFNTLGSCCVATEVHVDPVREGRALGYYLIK